MFGCVLGNNFINGNGMVGLPFNGSIFEFDVSTDKIARIGIGDKSNTTTIDWGDGTIDTIDVDVTSGSVTHTYNDNIKIATVKVSNTVIAFIKSWFFGSFSPNITKIYQLGNLIEKITDGRIVGDSQYLEYANLSNATKIKHVWFAGCKNLKECILPPNVEYLMYTAFEDCGSLKYIDIPQSIIGIGDYSFRKCYSLETVNIHKSKDSISGAPWDAPESTTINWIG